MRRPVSDESTRKVADTFDDWARSGRDEGMEMGHSKTALPLLESIRFEGGTRFLDLGCGNGWAARTAAQWGARARGIDASPEMVERARALAAKDKLPVRFQAGDFEALPFKDDEFDIAWSMEALYYAEDPDEVLWEVKRVLQPGGVFHVLLDYYEENEASHDWPQQTGVPMVLRSGPQWAQAFVDAGFQDVQITRLKAPEDEDVGQDDWKRTEGTLHVSGRA